MMDTSSLSFLRLVAIVSTHIKCNVFDGYTMGAIQTAIQDKSVNKYKTVYY